MAGINSGINLHGVRQAPSGAEKNQSPPGARAPGAGDSENRLGFYVGQLGLEGER